MQISTIIYTIAFTCFIAIVQGAEVCPEPARIIPCTCESIEDRPYMSCENIENEEELEEIFSANFPEPQLEYISIANSSLQEITKNVFGETSSKIFNFIVTDIQYYSETAFENSKESLIELTIEESPITSLSFPFSSLKSYTSLNVLDLVSTNLTEFPPIESEILRHLSIDNSYIKTILNELFTDVSNLFSLSISNNEVEFIEDVAFQDLSALEELYLYGNSISDQSFLANLPSSLTVLNLNSNDIYDFIEPGIFNETSLLSNLTVLELSHNELTYIYTGTFAGLQNLQVLTMNGNQINTIDSEAFSGLQNLQTLTMNSNSISSIHSETFSGLPNLQLLALNSNQISNINAGAFSDLQNLQELRMNNNGMVSIRSGIFNGLQNLQVLTMNSNEIASISSGTFSGLPNLQVLEMNSNLIGAINAGMFSGLQNLQVLALNSNKIFRINTGALIGLQNLQELTMDSNVIGINPIAAGTFSDLQNLQKLTMNSNSLLTISSGQLDGLFSLTRLELSHNIIYYINSDTFSNATELQILTLDNNDLTSIEPGTFASTPLLSTLQLHFNQITTLLAGTFSGLGLNNNTIEISLYNNTISYIEEDAFGDIADSTIQIDKNSLTVLEEAWLRPVLDQNNIVSLNGNPFTCECETAWVFEDPKYKDLLSAQCSNGTDIWDLNPSYYATNC